MCLCVFESVSLCVYVSVCLSVRECVCASVCLSVCMCVYVCVFASMHLHSFVSLAHVPSGKICRQKAWIHVHPLPKVCYFTHWRAIIPDTNMHWNARKPTLARTFKCAVGGCCNCHDKHHDLPPCPKRASLPPPLRIHLSVLPLRPRHRRDLCWHSLMSFPLQISSCPTRRQRESCRANE